MSPLRRSARASRTSDQPSPEPSAAAASSTSPTKDRKRRHADDMTLVTNGRSTRSTSRPYTEQSDDDGEEVSADSPHDSASREMEDVKPSRDELTRDLRELLGLPGSSSATASSIDIKAEPDAGDELILSSDNAVKLAAIVQHLSPSLLQSSATKLRKGKGRSATAAAAALPPSHISLKDALSSGMPLREVRQHVCLLREPLLQQYKTSPGEPLNDATTLPTLTLLLGLIDQMARELRHADPKTQAFRGQKLASSIEDRATALEDIDLEFPSQPESSSRKEDTSTLLSRYSLHMRLPKADYFSKAVELEAGQAAALDSGLADLVKVAPQSTSHMLALKHQGLIATPTLGSRMGRAKLRRVDKDADSKTTGLLKPVTFLNYGNYASFAPTYDSSASTLSHTASRILWQDSAHARLAESSVWGPEPFAQAEDHEFIWRSPAPHHGDETPLPSTTQKPTSVPADLAIDLDAEAFEASVEVLEQEEVITSHLRFNMMLLHRLQEFQWARLRESFVPSKASKSITDDSEIPPSTEEQATASLLLDSLGALLALQPQSIDLQSGGVAKVVPDAAVVRAFSHSSGAIDPALTGDSNVGYWGTLDEAVSHSARAKAEPSVVLHDNMSIRLSEESAIKAKKTSRRGVPGMAVEDHGRGALERIASTRTYDHRKDRHDIEPRAPAVAVEQPPPMGHKTSYGTDTASPAASRHGGMQPPSHTPQRGASSNASYAFTGAGATPTASPYGYQARSVAPIQGQYSSSKQQRPHGTPTHLAPGVPSNRFSPYHIPQKR